MLGPIIAAVAGFSVLVAANPVPAALVTAAPVLLKRQQGCSFTSTTYTDRNPTDDTPIATEALNLCYCSGTAAAVTTSTGSVGVSTVVYQICGDATQTTTNYIQPSWSADPSISAAAQVIFGDLNPLDLINSISSQCVTACPTTGTAKASYFPVNEPATGTITTDGATSTITVTYAEATAVDITYSVSAKMQNVTDRDYLFDVVNVLSKQGSTQATMNYRGDQPALQAPFPSGVTTQYVGPGSVGVDRWQNVNLSPDDYSSLIDSLSISFSSKLEGGSGLTCSEIEGPIASLLGLIPGIGSFFSIIGSLACTAGSVGTPS